MKGARTRLENTMLRMKCLSLIAGLALVCPGAAFAALPALSVHVTNALPNIGTVEVTLFSSEEAFLKQAYLQQSGEASESGELIAEFAGLEEGEYAVTVIHDENGNQAYDPGVLGFGKEGLGYSNNVRPWFGRPDFDDVKFSVKSESTTIEIRLD